MYTYHKPQPVIVKLTDEIGYNLREKAAKYVADNENTSGAERGNREEQGFGALAEIFVRHKLGLPEINPSDHPIGYDLLTPSGVKIDVKCRGGTLPFQEEYLSSDDIPREAKHNFFARQIYDDSLDADIYVMTHMETPSNRELPGTKRQRKWTLYVCGWVSKERVKREGVYLPRGSLTEQGKTWFTYRGQEIEFYHKNLNGLESLEDLLKIDFNDVKNDQNLRGNLHLTYVDTTRIVYDLIGRGILNSQHLEFIKEYTKLDKTVKPILHVNQYFHLMRWLEEKGVVTEAELAKLNAVLSEEPFAGI